ncbi:MAG TPA: hypothetical protein VNP02_08635, partial [Gammaproteobacteria bacterium]|nr:hypothetical protein [Gammaproteobacteria bacterium]
YVLDPNAEWIAVSTGPHDPKVFASDYLRLRQRHGASSAATTARDGGSAANAGSNLRPPGA